MNKLITIMAIAFILFSFNTLSFAAGYYVDAINGNDENSGFSEDKPLKTISRALSIFKGMPDNPAIINIAAGNYDLTLGEGFPLKMKDNIQLIGAGNDSTIIDASGSSSSVISASGAQNVRIEAFAVMGGEGDLGQYDYRYGGGINCQDSTLDIINCEVTENKAVRGGGIHFKNSSGSIEGCHIYDNTYQYGGGIFCDESSPSISNCSIESNNYEIDANGFGGLGGAIDCRFNSSPKITNCVITDHVARWGGAIYINDDASPTIEDCIFERNTAEYIENYGGGYGGSISVWGESNLFIKNSIFLENTALWGGGILVKQNSYTEIRDCVFEDNSSIVVSEYGGSGGAIRAEESKLKIEDSDFLQNSAKFGGGVRLYISDGEITNSNFNENKADVSGGAFYADEASSVVMSYSNFEINTAKYGGALFATEPDTIISMINCVINENKAEIVDGSGGYGGGIYIKDSASLTLNESYIEYNEAHFGGGIYAIEAAIEFKDSFINNNKSESNGEEFCFGAGVYFMSIVKGKVENCEFNNNSISHPEGFGSGGGVLCSKSSVEFINCYFQENRSYMGSAVTEGFSSNEYTNCRFTGNSAFYEGEITGGGGLMLGESNSTFDKCIIENNESDCGAGVLIIENSSPVFTNCTITNNTASLYGGGFYVEGYSLPEITNCLITDNEADEGAAVFSQNSDTKLTLCTITGNKGDYASGYYNYRGGNSVLESCILWNNGSYQISGYVTVSYSNVEGGYDGEGNIDQEPAFTTGPRGDYYLSCMAAGDDCSSPCIDTGNPEGIEDFNHKDYITRCDGVVDTSTVDMGFHYIPHINFGLGVTPVKFAYKDGDDITLNLDLETASVDTTSDVYLLLMNPEGKFLPGMSWSPGLKPLVSGITLPADLAIESSPLFTFTLPDTNPPVDDPGWYTFYITALKPGTVDFISNIASSAFQVK